MKLPNGVAALGVAALLSASGAAAQTAPQPAPRPAPAGPRIMFVTFRVADLDRSIAFYTRAIGLTLTGRLEHPKSVEVMLMFPGSGAGLLLVADKAPSQSSAQPKLGPVARGGRIIVAAPDLAAAQRRLESAGFALKSPIRSQPNGKVETAVAVDPDGNELELVQIG